MPTSQIHSMDLEHAMVHPNAFGVEPNMDLILHDAEHNNRTEFRDNLSKEETMMLQTDLKRMVWGPLHSRYLFFVMGLLQFVCGMQFAMTPYILNEPPRFPICEGGLGGSVNQVQSNVQGRLLGGVPVESFNNAISNHVLDSVILDNQEKLQYEESAANKYSICLPDTPLQEFDCTTKYKYYFEGLSAVDAFHVPSSICEPDPMKNTTFPKSALLIGFGLGAWLNGIWMDKSGRRRVVSWSILLFVVSGISTAFSETINAFFLWRFLTGFAMSGMSIGSFILICELTNRRNRRKIVASYAFYFVLGSCVTAIVGTMIMQWNVLVLVLTAPLVLVPLWILCVQFNVESPRFYLACGDDNAAMQVYRRIAAYNGNGLEEKMANIDETNVRDFVDTLFDDIDEDVEAEGADGDLLSHYAQEMEGSSPHSDNFLFNPERSRVSTAINDGREQWFSALKTWPMHLWIWNIIILYTVCQVQYFGISMDTTTYEAAFSVFSQNTGLDVDNLIMPYALDKVAMISDALHNRRRLQRGFIPVADERSSLMNLPPNHMNRDPSNEGSILRSGEGMIAGHPSMEQEQARKEQERQEQERKEQERQERQEQERQEQKEKARQQQQGHEQPGQEQPGQEQVDITNMVDANLRGYYPPAPTPFEPKLSENMSPESLLEISSPDLAVNADDEVLILPDENQKPAGVYVGDDDDDDGDVYGSSFHDNWDWVKNKAVQKYEAIKNFKVQDMESSAKNYMDSTSAKIDAMFDISHPLYEYFSSIRHYTITYLTTNVAELLFQLAAVWFCGWNLFGRKAIITSWMALAGLLLICMGALKFPFAMSHMPDIYFGELFFVFGSVARLLTVGAMVVLQLLMIELFPSSVRGGSYGFTVMIATVATLASPYLYQQAEDILPGSFIVLIGAMAILASFATLATIPDTLTRPSYDTLYELKNASEEDVHISSTMAPCKYCCYDMAHVMCCCCFKNSEYLTRYKDSMSKKALKRTALLMVLEGKKEVLSIVRKTKNEMDKFATPKNTETERHRD